MKEFSSAETNKPLSPPQETRVCGRIIGSAISTIQSPSSLPSDSPTSDTNSQQTPVKSINQTLQPRGIKSRGGWRGGSSTASLAIPFTYWMVCRFLSYHANKTLSGNGSKYLPVEEKKQAGIPERLVLREKWLSAGRELLSTTVG